MIITLEIVIGAVSWLAGFEWCWHRYVAPLRERIAAEQRGQLDRWTFEAVPEIAKSEPKLEVAVWLSTIDPITGRVENAALVPLHANTDKGARN